MVPDPTESEHSGSAQRREPAADELSPFDKSLRDAPMTATLIAVNIGVFAAEVIVAGAWRFALGTLGEQDDRIWKHTLLWLGANASSWTIADSRFETLVTSTFLHWTLLHVAFNGLALWQIGTVLEREVGASRLLPAYLVGGIAASAASAIAGRFGDPRVSVGASGAICALLGAILVQGITTEGVKGRLARFVGGWVAIIVIFGLAIGQFDNAAHLGGAIGGIAVAATWRRTSIASPMARRLTVTACAAIVILSGAVVFVRNRTDRYLFMDVEARFHAARLALEQSRCADAHEASSRALRMDPGNETLHGLVEAVERECPSRARY